MAKRKSKLKTKVRQAKRKLSRKKLSKFFITLILSIIFISIGLYFLFFNDENIKSEPLKIEPKKPSLYQEKQALNEKKILEELKVFENKVEQKEEHFEEVDLELEKSYIEENKEILNEKIEKKIEEIKKINDEKELIEKVEIKKDAKIEEPKTEEKLKEEKLKEEKLKEEIKKEEKIKEDKIKKEEPKKYDEKSIISSKDRYIHDPKRKPKLIVIIDDVSTEKQKQSILNIGYPVTMAFLPPTSGHKDSAKIAQSVAFHMIHFPMQASSAFKGPETDTLKVTDSYEKIEERVRQLRAWYPKAKYTNNHTGSVFTENDEAMARLYKALDKYNFVFVDSRTSAKSVAKKYSVKYNMPYIVRNTFLDNTKDYKAIQNQLLDAVRIAKKQGYAIAIGHPYDVTIKVLKESKHLLNEVEPVLLNKLPYL
jgi:uncharacterized protein